MKSIEKIREDENRYKKLLNERLGGDARLSLSCPDFKYPEPLYFYIRSVKTDKTIAVRIDGGDGTMRFWDYVDDGYENEDGVWAEMTDEGFESFIAKLYGVMDIAVDIEFYDAEGLTDDYYAGVLEGALTESSALELLKQHSDGVKFMIAKICNFYGDKTFVFNKHFCPIRRRF